MKFSFWLEKFLYNHADQVVVNSPGFIKSVSKISGKIVSLIPNGSDISFFYKPNISKTRNELGWEKKFIILYAGAHGMSNDLGVVLQCAKLLSDNTDIHFVLLGDGKEKQNLVKEAAQLNLANLSFMDPIPKIKVPEILSTVDACIAILKPIEMYKTTYPNKVFDYMAARKPIILAIDGVIREVIEKSGCGIFSIPGDPRALADSCLFLYNNQDTAISMGNKGYEYLIVNFDREKIAQDLLEILKDMVKSRG